SACREIIQSAVLKAFQMERERSKQPGYVCTYDDYDSDEFEGTSYTQIVAEVSRGGYRTHGPHNGGRGGHGPPRRHRPPGGRTRGAPGGREQTPRPPPPDRV